MNQRARASLHSLPYLLLIAVVLPWAFARWLGSGPITILSVGLGGLFMVAGVGLSGWCVNFLLTLGQGTQSPLDPTKNLVVGGPYRYVRNPMILGNVLLVIGEAVLFSAPGILLYALLFWSTWHLLLVRLEEPSLRRRFGSEYETYQRQVPRWLPRVTHGSRRRAA